MVEQTTRYGVSTTVDLPYATAVQTTREELAREGFGVLTEIDVQATLKKKLGKDMRPYKILGACNPQFAHRAIEAEPQIGALLPCNVVVRVDDADRTVVEIMDPEAVLKLTQKPEIINTDPYGEGWIFVLEMSDPSEVDGLMDAAAYQRMVEEG